MIVALNSRQDYKEHHDDINVHFVINLAVKDVEKAEEQGLTEFFKLTSKINTNNMICFDFEGKIRDLHGWASPHGFTVRVVTATASGRDIAARAPPVPVLGLCRYFCFFARRTSAPKKVDRVQIDPRCQCLQPRLSSVFFTATSESRRLSRFSIHRRPPFLTVTSGTP